MAEIRSVRKGKAEHPSVFKVLIKIDRGKPKIVCRVKTVGKDIPLPILMRALGLSSDEEIFKSICYKLVELS